MSALPAELPDRDDDPLDPERIRLAMPESERAEFVTAYRQHLDAARDPADFHELRRWLRLCAFRALAMAEPGYFEAREYARAGTGDGMLLDDYLRQRRGA